MIWVEFFICAVLIIGVSTLLSRYGDVLAEKTGLGRAWVGAILLASVTSLPEMVSGISAVAWLNVPNLAIGAILGSCLFNLALIAIMDVVYQPGSILAKAQEGHILSGGLGVLLLGIVAAGAFLGAGLNGLGPLGLSFASLAIASLYFVGARLIAQFEGRRYAEVLEKGAEARHYDQIRSAPCVRILCLSLAPQSSSDLVSGSRPLATGSRLKPAFRALLSAVCSWPSALPCRKLQRVSPPCGWARLISPSATCSAATCSTCCC